MRTRLELQTVLEGVLSRFIPNATRRVWFQSPGKEKLVFPCILYVRSGEWVRRANDHKYVGKKEYTITVIDKDPDSGIPDAIGELQYCMFDHFYAEDNLNHWVFSIYF